MSFPEIGLCHVPTWLELPRGYFDVQIKNISRLCLLILAHFRYFRFVRWLLMVTVTLRACFDLLLFEWKWEVSDFSFEYCTELFKNDKITVVTPFIFFYRYVSWKRLNSYCNFNMARKKLCQLVYIHSAAWMSELYSAKKHVVLYLDHICICKGLDQKQDLPLWTGSI